jgi:hypothetical protein
MKEPRTEQTLINIVYSMYHHAIFLDISVLIHNSKQGTLNLRAGISPGMYYLKIVTEEESGVLLLPVLLWYRAVLPVHYVQ